jgi:hypothetical protein
MKKIELSAEERELIALLEPAIRNSVWNSSAKVYEGPYDSDGKWIEYPLRHPTERTTVGKPLHLTLKPENTTEEFLNSYCAFGTNHMRTSVAVYRILRRLKQRGLLHVPGFDQWDVGGV